MARAEKRRGQGGVDRFEGEAVAFHALLREKFLDIARAEPGRCRVIDASRPEDEVAAAISRGLPRQMAASGFGRETMGVSDRDDLPPESDRFEPAPHPRDTLVLFGHDKAERELLDAFRNRRLPQAWIIGGPQGIGKATLAWRMARFIAANPDPAPAGRRNARKILRSIPTNPAARRISAMSFGDLALLRREWNEKTKKHCDPHHASTTCAPCLHLFEQSAGEGGWRMAIIDSADDLNVNSANALLKLIEEPPPRSLFFLIVAHHPGRILPTIRSRCRLLTLQRTRTTGA